MDTSQDTNYIRKPSLRFTNSIDELFKLYLNNFANLEKYETDFFTSFEIINDFIAFKELKIKCGFILALKEVNSDFINF